MADIAVLVGPASAAAAGVTSVFGRVGAVVAMALDYIRFNDPRFMLPPL